MPLVSVIIPYFNKWDLCHARLNEFHKFVPQNDVELILIDDASTEEDCQTGLAWWQKQVNYHTIRYHRNEENVGFGHSMNNGAKLAKGDVLVFYSNDVKMYRNFIPELLALLAKDENVLIGNEVIYWDGGWNSFEIDGKKLIIPYANGWFIACTRKVWTALGGFDWKTFGKFDYEDCDLSTRAIELGYNVVGMNSKAIEHAHQGATVSTLNIDRMSLTKQNRLRYIAKWQERLVDIQRKMEKPDYGRNTDKTKESL
jgi:GT2 family glycosyltransferase